ncbi:MAG TPA: proline--tRNA ligase [Planctomycetota bacterium]|nr:proline--tRNA ligase [Planctomycetota bacterium]
MAKDKEAPKNSKSGITPRDSDYAQWYLDVIARADLADYAPVKGCMIIKPYGYAIWEGIRDALDKMIKDTGHQNAYFPLFIPLSFLEKEAKHVEGFAMECAVVTHSGLEKGPDGKLQPTGKIEEPLVVRPTSETIIGWAWKKWVSSWRDLPLLHNQWANVVRWEMRTRLFLRTLEFLWQEGHTAHATPDEAREEVRRMLDVYRVLSEEWLAVAVVPGEKTEGERFPGAVNTYSIEAMMQDRKALQAGTSHYLGQNFSKAFDVAFQSKEGKLEHCYTTSWGVSTRLVGGLIMSHGDDKGLIVPPKLAPYQVVIVPIFKSDEEAAKVRPVLETLRGELKAKGIRLKVDDRDNLSPGNKFYEWEGKGAPVRVEVGPKDVDKGQVVEARRDTGAKRFVPVAQFLGEIEATLRSIQDGLLAASRKRLEEKTFAKSDYAGLREVIEAEAGWVRAPWCGGSPCEAKVKEETKATIRCIPIEGGAAGAGEKCVVCGGDAKYKVLFAKAY